MFQIDEVVIPSNNFVIGWQGECPKNEKKYFSPYFNYNLYVYLSDPSFALPSNIMYTLGDGFYLPSFRCSTYASQKIYCARLQEVLIHIMVN